MPATNPKFQWNDQRLIGDAIDCLTCLKPKLVREDVVDATVKRLTYAKAVCEVGFVTKLPPMQTAIAGLQIGGTSFYYPEDRSLSESVRFGMEISKAIRGQ